MHVTRQHLTRLGLVRPFCSCWVKRGVPHTPLARRVIRQEFGHGMTTGKATERESFLFYDECKLVRDRRGERRTGLGDIERVCGRVSANTSWLRTTIEVDVAELHVNCNGRA